jgi:hypothetical protein
MPPRHTAGYRVTYWKTRTVQKRDWLGYKFDVPGTLGSGKVGNRYLVEITGSGIGRLPVPHIGGVGLRRLLPTPSESGPGAAC